MNISLRKVQINSSQTTFITSSGTLLFTSHTLLDQRDHQAVTLVTSIDDHGSHSEVGLIKWNEEVEDLPYLRVGARSIDLRTTSRDQFTSLIFEGTDKRMYRWRKRDDLILLSPCDNGCIAPIAIVYDEQKLSPMVNDSEGCASLCVQPSGFHLLHEIVVTSMLFERYLGNSTRVHAAQGLERSSLHGGRWILRQDAQKQSPKGNCLGSTVDFMPSPTVSGRQDCIAVPQLRMRRTRLTHSTVDLTGELLRRYKYPSAYGGFGDIWKCDWLRDSRVIEVAVKVMRTNLTEDELKDVKSKRISRELKVWVKLEHENVLPLYGITFDFGKVPAMVCPWIEDGTLSGYLERRPGLSLQIRLQLLNDIADGLHYLHGCGIVHGDLTGSNVLIKGNGKACLSDFGLSVIFMEATGSSYFTSTIRGNVRWAAPELFDLAYDQQSEPVQILPKPQSDIYSFGSVMLQVFTGKIPFYYYKNDAQVLVALTRGLRPARPNEPHIDDVHWDFMQRCWSSSQNVRPTIEEVINFLSVARTSI